MEKLKSAIIGCGAIYKMHAYPISGSDIASLACVCDIDLQKAKQAAEIFGCRYYTDYQDMLAHEQLDIVHICTPHYLHADMAVAAISAGCHVICEKPMALSLDDAARMKSSAEKSGKLLGIVYQNRFNPGSLLIKRMLDSGELGRIYGARMNVCWHRDEAYYQQGEWRGTWDKEGGGVIINQSIHTFDLMRWFIGEKIIGVEANLSNRTHETVEVEDTAEGMIRFESGLNALFYATVNFSRDDDVELVLHCENGTAQMCAAKATVTLHDGRTLIADTNPADYYVTDAGAKEYWGFSHVKLIHDFYHAVLDDGKPFVTADEAYLTQELICGLYESGKPNFTISTTKRG